MNKDSLITELTKLKEYLNAHKSISLNPTESKIVSHTLIGTIMTIHNLINTGAYDNYSNQEFYDLIEESRNLALHYGYFNEYETIKSEAINIVENTYFSDKDYFASTLSNIDIEKSNYFHIAGHDNIQINTTTDLLELTNLHTKESIYFDLNNVIILKNKTSNKDTYLLKDSNEPIIFYKPYPESKTEKLTYSDFRKTSFYQSFKFDVHQINFSSILEKLIFPLKDDPYKNIIIAYQYDNKTTKAPLHKVLNNLLKNRTIDERIVLGKYTFIDFDKIKHKDRLSISDVNLEKLADSMSLKDAFFVELFLKRYHAYWNLVTHNPRNDYSNQSMLLNLYEVSLSKLSEEFISSDYTKQFSTLYYEYKKIRKELAHTAITDMSEKKKLLENMEFYTDEIYNLLLPVYKIHLTRLAKNPLNKLSISKSVEKKQPIIHNKTTQYYLVKHKNSFKMIDDKKYLKLDENNIYLEIDRSLLVYDFINQESQYCLIPYDQVKTVSINNNKISKASFNLSSSEIIKFDTQLQSLLQAFDFLRAHPCYTKKNHEEDFVAITFLDENEKAIYTEGLGNLLYRRYSLKIIPSTLLNCSDLLLAKNFNEPLILLDKNKNKVAKIFLAHLDKNNNLKQISKNSVETEIDYGKLLAKDLKLNEFIINKKEGR